MKLKYLVGVMLTMFILSSCDDTTNEIGTSLIHDMDNLDVTTDTFKVSSRTLVADSVYSRSTYGYLGTIRDPETGNVIKGNFMTQFCTLEDYARTFPAADSIASRLDGQSALLPKADDVVLHQLGVVRSHYQDVNSRIL